MKTHTIKTPTAELLIVELPERASMLPVAIINGNTYISYSPAPFAPPTNLELLANGNWEALGKPDEIREEDARELVESDEISDVEDYRYQTTFIDYKDEENSFPTATESLLSLLETEIFWDVNPYGTRESNTLTEGGHEIWAYSDEHYSKWHEAEQKTFDRSRSIILVKQ